MFPIDTDQILTAAAVFLRITCIITLLPLFGDGGVPVRIRLMLSAALTAGIYPLVPPSYSAIMHNAVAAGVGSMTLLVIKEMFIGLVLGYVAKLAFDGIVMSANVVGIQMGFNTSNIFLPDSSETTNGFSALHRLLIILVFLSLNMHHVYLSTIHDSFQLIPLGFAWPSSSLAQIMVHVSASLFVTALQLAAPTLVGLLFATAALGLVSRAVPQANVFVLSFPVSFFTGLFIYMAMLPMLPGWLRGHFIGSQSQMMVALAALVK
ncbi:MAG: flagellar biosynthetic protein FliR [Proteobacteria bacterium]|nr:flagellar biosynthetic protein FliR [Pseudomonadota bacterium]